MHTWTDYNKSTRIDYLPWREYTYHDSISQSISMNHLYSRKSWSTLFRQPRMTHKLDPTTSYTILKNYRALLLWIWSFTTVNDLCKNYHISRNMPAKILTKFHSLWNNMYPDKSIDYSVNIFLQRSKHRKHRTLPKEKQYHEFISAYPRWWHQTYEARCNQQGIKQSMKKWMFYYFKESSKALTNSHTIPKHQPKKAPRITAKERYDELYKKYDLVIHLDGKSMEDQPLIQENNILKHHYKRLSIAVEARSWVIVWIRPEQSHNKSNSLLIIKEICDHIKQSFGSLKVCFITDAWSEYLNNKLLRGIEVTWIDESCIAIYLKEQWHSRRITRRPEDNWFIENKNDYIERACLDYKWIKHMNGEQFINHLDQFIQLNNCYLKWSKKSYRWEWKTPLENIKNRFIDYKALYRINWIHTITVGRLYHMRNYKNTSLSQLLFDLRPWMKAHYSWNHYFSNSGQGMHTKSVDSSTWELFAFDNAYFTCMTAFATISATPLSSALGTIISTVGFVT